MLDVILDCFGALLLFGQAALFLVSPADPSVRCKHGDRTNV